MIITKTPFRASFFGGGSDLEAFYSRSPGAVLSVTLNKFMYISSHPFFDENQIRLKYSVTETVDDVANLKHPIVREVLRRFNARAALEISSNADIPAGTGLGSSSAFTVGMLHNFYARSGRFVTRERLAEEACDIEINVLKEPIGKQDQYASAVGGLNVFKFAPNGQVEIETLHLNKSCFEALSRNSMLFYTGRSRATASILSEQRANMSSEDKFKTVQSMVQLVWQGRDALYRGDLREFGSLLDEGWKLKRRLAANISDEWLDSLYESAIAAGARGGKLLGAGSGGFLFFYCEEERQPAVRRALSNLREFRFRFENEGSKVIYVGDED